VFHDAKKLRIIMDNLNTHTYSSILETFEFKEAIEIISKVEFIYTPVHASWLNIAEIKINSMDKQCTDGRMKNKEYLISETEAYCDERNEKESKIQWTFTKEKADKKLSKYYI
jgi:hypothetical protein